MFIGGLTSAAALPSFAAFPKDDPYYLKRAEFLAMRYADNPTVAIIELWTRSTR